jgi:hypothetical protein
VNKIVERKQKLKERKDVFLQKVDELIFSWLELLFVYCL